jgi:hypothetical protein
MNKEANHPRLEMLMGFLPIDETYLRAIVVVNLSTMVAIVVLQKLAIKALQEVVVIDL